MNRYTYKNIEEYKEFELNNEIEMLINKLKNEVKNYIKNINPKNVKSNRRYLFTDKDNDDWYIQVKNNDLILSYNWQLSDLSALIDNLDNAKRLDECFGNLKRFKNDVNYLRENELRHLNRLVESLPY